MRKILFTLFCCVMLLTPPTTNKIFEWQMENSGVAETGGTGSSYGTTSFVTATPAPHDGTYSLKCVGGSGYSFAITSGDIVGNTGSMVFYIYWDTLSSSNIMVPYFGSYDDYLSMSAYDAGGGTWYLRFIYAGQGAAVAVSPTVGTFVTTGQWYKITLRWRPTGSPNLSLQVNANTPATDDTELSTWSTSSGTFYIGSLDAGQTYYLDNLKIWDAWDGPESGGTSPIKRLLMLLGVGK